MHKKRAKVKTRAEQQPRCRPPRHFPAMIGKRRLWVLLFIFFFAALELSQAGAATASPFEPLVFSRKISELIELGLRDLWIRAADAFHRFVPIDVPLWCWDDFVKPCEEVSLSQHPKAGPSSVKVAGEVAINDDILEEILKCLTVKPLLKFNSVSKSWHNLIRDPAFAYRWNPDQMVTGLFLQSPWECVNQSLNFIHLPNNGNPVDNAHLKNLTAAVGLPHMRILNSCHGLFCCYSEIEPLRFQYHVLNPTTKQIASLCDPPTGIKSLSLAFEPDLKGSHFKVVCVCSVSVNHKNNLGDWIHQIWIYSSETGSWRTSREPFVANHSTQFSNGVHWNGAINWFSTRGDSLYFKVDEEHLGTMPRPNEDGGKFCYFGESHDHLHLVEIDSQATWLRVYEMERDYSRWFEIYSINLNEIAAAFPAMTQGQAINTISLAVLSLVRRDKDRRSSIFLHLPHQIISYNIEDQTLERICDVAQHLCDSSGMMVGSLKAFQVLTFQYIPSLFHF